MAAGHRPARRDSFRLLRLRPRPNAPIAPRISPLSNTYHTLLASFAMRETAGVGALSMIFETLDTFGHEQVVFCHNKDAGLKAIIAIHNTVLGPALGGLRMWPYKTEADALNDVLRLSRGMTYKNAVAGLNIGGGKARDHRRPGDRQVRGAVPRVRPVRRLAGRPLHHRRGRRHRRQRHGIRVPRDRVRHRRAPGARRLGRPLAVHRLRHAAGPDGHAQQEVRRRGSRQVLATPCRAWATSAWSS